MSSSPIIQVDCASCGTTYRLALPKVLVDRPHKSMSFRCNHCSYKFQIQPKDILEQQAVASTLILVESNGFHVHHNLESVADLIEAGTYVAEDTIRVFGQDWSMMGDEPSLASLFKSDVDESNEHNEEDAITEEPPELLDGVFSDVVEEPSVGDVETVNAPLDFEEGDEPNASEADSEQDFSEIDPFSEGYSTAVEDDVPDEVLEDILEEPLDADFFADAIDSEPEDQEVQTVNDDFDDFVIEDVDLDEDVFSNVASDVFPDDYDSSTEQATDVDGAPVVGQDFGQTVVDDFTEDLTQVGSTLEEDEDPASFFDSDDNIEEIDEGNRDSAQLSGFDDDDFEDIDDEFAVQAIEANLWDELEDSEEDEILQSLDLKPAADEGEEHNIQSTKSALLAAPNSSESVSTDKLEKTKMQVANQEDAMVPQMELDDAESDLTTAARVGQTKIDKPKQRLSFSNKVPEVKRVKKREINGLHAFAFIVLFCIIVIVGTWMQVNRDKQEFAGIETNSNMLKPMTEPKKRTSRQHQ